MPINDIGTIYTPSIYGRTSFPLQHKGDSIFYKTFNSEDSNIVILNDNVNLNKVDKNVIYIPNHFFKTGEPLKYNFVAGDIPVGIAATSPGASGITTQFPNVVYPIVVDKNNIRIALTEAYANTNDYVYINSLGIGTQHSFECFKQNSKCLITISNIIQSPISVASTVKVLSHTDYSLVLENLKNIKTGTCLRINDELVRISSVNYDANRVTLSRGSNILGTGISTFLQSLNNSYIDILSGNYNIIKDVIYFDEPPLEGRTLKYKIAPTDIIFSDYSFNLLSDTLKTGSQILMIWENPPTAIPNQKFYYVIKNSENNFSFAETYSDAINGIKVQFDNTTQNGLPITDIRLVYFYPTEENAFNGRVFLRSNYSGNSVFDDISEQFTGITSSFELKTSGISTVGIKSDNGILLINNIFQYPGSNESFVYNENGSKTNVNFVGFGTTGFIGKSYDVNVKGYPRGGIIISYGTTSGSYYQPLTSYNNLPLSGSSTGIGASVSFNVDEYGNVKDFKFTNHGYNYKVGEILVPLNTLGIGTQTSDDKIHITLNETTKDSFNAWNVGILDKLDDLSSKVDGYRKTFSLYKNGQRISLDAGSEYEIDFPYNLLVFVNDVLQVPNSSYRFTGGSIITFTEAIPRGSDVKIYFYRGYADDTFVGSNVSKIKEGDVLRLVKDIYRSQPTSEKNRIIKEFISSDILKTTIYSDIGISESSSQLRSITWTPQKSDLILEGSFISKSRSELNSGITTFTKLSSAGISTTNGVFVGISTNIIQVNTSSGIGTLIQIKDYVEGEYLGMGITVTSINGNYIGISTNSDSPSGTNTIPISFYRKS